MSKIDDYQYFFIGGVLGEALSLWPFGNYFKSNMSYLKKMGISSVRFMPSSKNSALENTEIISQKIEELFKTNKKEVVLVGHSKGGQELLLLLLKNPKLLSSGMIKSVFLIQSSLNGSSLVDILFDFSLIKPLKNWEGLTCMLKGSYRELCQEAVSVLSKDTKDLLSEKVTIIRGYKDKTGDVAPILKLGHYLLKKEGHLSDGLVPFEEQKVDFFDFRTFDLYGDHSDFIISPPMSYSGNKTKREFTQGLIDFVNNDDYSFFEKNKITR